MIAQAPNTLWEQAVNANREKNLVPRRLGAINENAPKAALALDIGATAIKWSLVKVEDGEITKEVLASGKVKTVKGIVNLQTAVSEAISNALTACNTATEGVSYILCGIGAGIPAKLLTKPAYDLKYGDATENFSKATKAELGFNPATPIQLPVSINWPVAQNVVVADGNGPNLGKDKDEFNGVNMLHYLLRGSVAGIEISTENDAACQAKAIYNIVKDDLTGKGPIMYYGPGGGTGGAVLDAEGNIVTDGHIQYHKLARRDGEYDGKVFEIISKNCGLYDGCTMAEDILSSAKGINAMIKSTYGEDFNTEDFDDIYLDGTNQSAEKSDAVEKLKALGRYLGDYIALMHSGDFENVYKSAEWTDEDKAKIKGLTDVLVGGDLARNSSFFEDLILGEAQKILKEKNIDVKFHLPKQVNVDLATAQIISSESLAMTPDELSENHEAMKKQKGFREDGAGS